MRDYCFAFNGKESDNEVAGNGNQYDYGFRIYNPRIAKFLSVDPLTSSYPWYTPYQFAGNKPIWAIDLDGLEEWVVTMYYTSFDDQDPVIEYTFDEELEELQGGSVYVVHNYMDGDFIEFTRTETSSDLGIPMNAVDKSSAPNFNSGDNYDIRNKDVAPLQFDPSKNGEGDLFNEFVLQTGPTNSLFIEDHPMIEGVKQMGEVDRLRFLVYDKYNGEIPADGSYTDFAGKFGIPGALSTNTLAGQFVGSFTGDVFVDEAGENLIFVISDAKSQKSFFARLGGDYEREDSPIMGNTYQKYIWSEPIDNSSYTQQKDKRNTSGYYDENELEIPSTFDH